MGDDAAPYGVDGWERQERLPTVVWHPSEPLLLILSRGRLVRWHDGAVTTVPVEGYHYVAFSPDGSAVWGTPSTGDDDDAWESHDVLDLFSGTWQRQPLRWDTGIAAHPAGGLVATLHSDQGTSLLLFAHVDGNRMRVRDLALTLDGDGYQTPMFSPDGRHVAVCGNAYGPTLRVFDFPSLQCTLALSFAERVPHDGVSQELLDEPESWPLHNKAFTGHGATFWVGTPAGVLIEIDVADHHAVEHVLLHSPVTALAAAADGRLLAATSDGTLHLLSVPGAIPAPVRPELVREYLDTTTDIPENVTDLWLHLTLTDGHRTWNGHALATVTTAAETDPSWLQITAAVNRYRDDPPGNDPWSTAEP